MNVGQKGKNLCGEVSEIPFFSPEALPACKPRPTPLLKVTSGKLPLREQIFFTRNSGSDLRETARLGGAETHTVPSFKVPEASTVDDDPSSSPHYRTGGNQG